MANKRELKKAIKTICGDIAGECIVSRDLVPGIDPKKMEEIIFKIADLQYVSVDNVTFSFDKAASSFENPHAYKVAREAYFRKGYAKLIAEFNNNVEAIVREMNAALPQAQKDANKAQK
ncbi:MAG: hypothetical protein NC127_08745 [Muribaculum sp.]|nr:hypothetical protein [Muribaculum sp.]